MTQTPESAHAGIAKPRPKVRVVRSLLLAVAAVWFLVQALSPIAGYGDLTDQLIPLVQRLALGFAVVSVALIDWSVFRGLFGIE